MFADAHDEDIVIDPDVSFHPAPSIDASRASMHRPSGDWGRPLQPSSVARGAAKVTFRTVQKRARAAAVIRRGTYRCNQPRGGSTPAFLRSDSAFATTGRVRSIGPRVLGHLQF
jgi:hypothetical protein